MYAIIKGVLREILFSVNCFFYTKMSDISFRCFRITIYHELFIGNRIYALGGTQMETGRQVRAVEFYDCSTGVWEENFRFMKGGFNMLYDCTTGVWEEDFRFRKGGYNMQYDSTTGIWEEDFRFRQGGFNMLCDCTTGVWEEDFRFRKGGYNMLNDCTTGYGRRISGSGKVGITC